MVDFGAANLRLQKASVVSFLSLSRTFLSQADFFWSLSHDEAKH